MKIDNEFKIAHYNDLLVELKKKVLSTECNLALNEANLKEYLRDKKKYAVEIQDAQNLIKVRNRDLKDLESLVKIIYKKLADAKK